MFAFPLSRRQSDRPATRRPHARSRRPLVEALEGRQLLTIFTVTNVNDSGSNSLRQAILSSNASTGTSTNTIAFAIGKSGTYSITLKTALPSITHPVIIDGTSQPGIGTSPSIVLNGADACPSGFSFTNQAPNSTLKGLAIVDFSSDGVVLSGSNGVKITDDSIGVMPDGTAAGNRADGILVTGKALNSTITGNVISGNSLNGVEGDYIGTDASGEVPLGNGGQGVLINNGSNDNTVGGIAPGAGNTISGNDEIGVKLLNESVSGGGVNSNVVEGNFIGTDAKGISALGNQSDGLVIDYGSDGNTIGGTTAAARNIISGNGGSGVVLSTGETGAPVSSNVVEGNYIGTTVSGAGALPNGHDGVLIVGSNHNTVGGTTTGAGNTISGNQGDGVYITGTSINNTPFFSTGNTVEGNDIGTKAGGATASGLGNHGDGVHIDDSSGGNTIGGTAAGAGNTISGNLASGVYVYQAGQKNAIEDDVIDANGSPKTPANQCDGVWISDSQTANTLVTGCTIDSNLGWGILLDTGSVAPKGNTFGTGSSKNGLGTIGFE